MLTQCGKHELAFPALLQQGMCWATPAPGAWPWWPSAKPHIPPGASLALHTWQVVLREKGWLLPQWSWGLSETEGQGAHKEPQRAEKCLCSPGNRARFYLIVAEVKANSCKARRESIASGNKYRLEWFTGYSVQPKEHTRGNGGWRGSGLVLLFRSIDPSPVSCRENIHKLGHQHKVDALAVAALKDQEPVTLCPPMGALPWPHDIVE